MNTTRWKTRSFGPALVLVPVVLLVSACAGAPAGRDAGSGDGGDMPECRDDADCASDMFCVDSVCVNCRLDDDCGTGHVCRDGDCQEGCPVDDRCEWGGSCCPGDQECVDRVCRPPCDGVRCGHRLELCCGSGQVCDEERCLIDCGAQARCGRNLDVCCAPGEICYGATCTSTTGSCAKLTDCPPGYVCELDLGICVEQDVVGDCLYHPETGVFTPYIKCRWTPAGLDVYPERDDVVMAPVVGSLTDDNHDGRTDLFDTPDLAFVSYDLEGTASQEQVGTLRIVSGACNPDGSMHTHASIASPTLDNAAGLALGDLNGDHVPEIVAMTKNGDRPQGTVAFHRVTADGDTWEVLWHNDMFPTWDVHTRGAAQPALADLDGDGRPEVIIGNLVLRGLDGTLLWDGVVTSAGTGGIGHNVALGPVSSVADIDLDGEPEVLAGNTCYGPDGTVEWSFETTSSNSRCSSPLACDGYTGTGNFDADPYGEVVIVRLGEVFILEHDGTLLAKAVLPSGSCPNNESGPPTVADFDGDGRPEIGTAAADFYVVVDLDCSGDPLPAECDAPGILWKAANRDCSSRVTASSVFDFEGDGQAEVIYADETTLRIFDGSDGTPLMVDQTHGSHTLLEMVIIADVDNDANAEIVVAENGTFGGTPGVEVWGDRQDNWVSTRRIWNQHSYHVTNVEENGQVPAHEVPNWQEPGLNNFRQNAQGLGTFWAPDLVVLQAGAVCEFGRAVYFKFDVVNQGSRMVPAGVSVALYVDDGLIAVVQTTRPLWPGHLEHFGMSWPLPPEYVGVPFRFEVRADDSGQGVGTHNECDDGGENNNSAILSDVFCNIEG